MVQRELRVYAGQILIVRWVDLDGSETRVELSAPPRTSRCAQCAAPMPVTVAVAINPATVESPG